VQHKIDHDSLAALPNGSGVYIFKGQGTLPLFKQRLIRIRRFSSIRLHQTDQATQVTKLNPQDFDRDSCQILVRMVMLQTINIQAC
jgi:hypothetical protein